MAEDARSRDTQGLENAEKESWKEDRLEMSFQQGQLEKEDPGNIPFFQPLKRIFSGQRGETVGDQ